MTEAEKKWMERAKKTLLRIAIMQLESPMFGDKHDPTDRWQIEEWDGTLNWVTLPEPPTSPSFTEPDEEGSSYLIPRQVIVLYEDGEAHNVDLSYFLSRVRDHSPNSVAAGRRMRLRRFMAGGTPIPRQMARSFGLKNS